ncbi:hypothetical protein A0J61_04675 [Choanephora cucurbitarum]|uniref:Uncharacterized protein n=1 Tax=Choanephora cucurbitarum TaxID=101091 RepID=A0A1C7NDW3_9FUNG|nr:hypothetical protein A0J61_04675 [Choanephora cucurbitarum]
MSKAYYNNNNTSDVDQEAPPPAYQETPPFNPNYQPPFHPSSSQPLYPQIPSAPQLVTPNTQVRYQTIEMPSAEPVQISTQRRHQLIAEHRKFPLAAIFFLFGWFCPPLWVIGACCCAGSRNPYESFWGKANFFMAMVMIITSVIYSMIAMNDF